jgi:restriction system protein
MNLLSVLHSNVFMVIACVLLCIILFKQSKKQRSSLHVRNIKLANKFLEKINFIANKNPALAFGYLRKINPFVFEELLLLAFKKQNYRIQENLRYTGDKGIDGTVFDVTGKKYLIQAKRYKGCINAAHVENFSALVNKTNAHAGFFIHTGRTGRKPYSAKSNDVRIISGSRLINLITGKDFLC